MWCRKGSWDQIMYLVSTLDLILELMELMASNWRALNLEVVWTRIYVSERSDKLMKGKTRSKEATVEILVGNEDGLNFLNFSSGTSCSFLLVFLLLCCLLLFCLLCSDFWPPLPLNVDALQGSVLRFLSRLHAYSLARDPFQPNGFKYHLDTDKPQIYVTSQDSPLTSRLIHSTARSTSPFRCLRGISKLALVTLNSWFPLWIC